MGITLRTTGSSTSPTAKPYRIVEKRSAKNTRNIVLVLNAMGSVPTSVVPPPFSMQSPMVFRVYFTLVILFAPGCARNAWQKCSV